MVRIDCAALLFDMDGVLLDFRPVVERTWRRWAARHGLDAGMIIRAAHGRRTSDSLRAVAPELATASEVAWLDAAELADLEGIEPVAGASALIATVPAGRWTVVTSAGRALAALRLQAVGLSLPANAVTSENVQRGKPAPDGYLLACERLGVRAADCLVVEDAPAGIESGLAAGARVLALTTTHPAAALSKATYVVRDFLGVRVTERPDGLEIDLDTATRTASR